MTKVNRNYCKPDADMKPVYAPAVFRYNGKDYWHPEKEDFALVGYLPLSPDYPVDPAPDGQHWDRTDKIERDGDGYRWVYALVDNPPPPPRRWTRLDILTALGESDMFDAAFAYLNRIEVKPHISAWLGLNTANYIEEGYPDAEKWNALLDGAAVALGTTREGVDEFLALIPTEG
jgi:hypothetical protein